jgi:hypothetical protein
MIIREHTQEPRERFQFLPQSDIIHPFDLNLAHYSKVHFNLRPPAIAIDTYRCCLSVVVARNVSL